MNKEQIINQLERNVSALKLAYSDLLTTSLQEGKLKYGSVAEYRKVKDNVRAQIDILDYFLKWVYLNNTEPLQDFNQSKYELTQEESYEQLLERSFGK